MVKKLSFWDIWTPKTLNFNLFLSKSILLKYLKTPLKALKHSLMNLKTNWIKKIIYELWLHAWVKIKTIKWIPFVASFLTSLNIQELKNNKNKI